MKEFMSAIEENESEDGGRGEAIPFKVDGRELKAYKPNDGQLVFLMAALGRGQTKEQRFASIINIMMASLRGEDQDYLESRLLDPDPKNRLQVPLIEQIFEYLMGEWFATPTQEPSDSAASPQSDGPN